MNWSYWSSAAVKDRFRGKFPLAGLEESEPPNANVPNKPPPVGGAGVVGGGRKRPPVPIVFGGGEERFIDHGLPDLPAFLDLSAEADVSTALFVLAMGMSSGTEVCTVEFKTGLTAAVEAPDLRQLGADSQFLVKDAAMLCD